jgi:hypothetical protein
MHGQQHIKNMGIGMMQFPNAGLFWSMLW